MNDGNHTETGRLVLLYGKCFSFEWECDKEVFLRTGKARAVFIRMCNIWKHKRINRHIKMRLNDSLILSTTW